MHAKPSVYKGNWQGLAVSVKLELHMLSSLSVRAVTLPNRVVQQYLLVVQLHVTAIWGYSEMHSEMQRAAYLKTKMASYIMHSDIRNSIWVRKSRLNEPIERRSTFPCLHCLHGIAFLPSEKIAKKAVKTNKHAAPFYGLYEVM